MNATNATAPAAEGIQTCKFCGKAIKHVNGAGWQHVEPTLSHFPSPARVNRFAVESAANQTPPKTEVQKAKIARAQLGTLEAAIRAEDWTQARVTARAIVETLKGL